MADIPLHLTETLLELAAEGDLPPAGRAAAEAHLAGCEHCRREVERRRALEAALAALPRFEPSAAFAEGVMARVRLAPAGSAAAVRRWLPRTRRGWAGAAALLLAPGLPLVLLVAWLFARPGVSLAVLAGQLLDGLGDAGWSIALHAADALIRLGALRGLELALDAVAAAGGITPVALAAAALVPLTLWAMLRLARLPAGNSPYAH